MSKSFAMTWMLVCLILTACSNSMRANPREHYVGVVNRGTSEIDEIKIKYGTYYFEKKFPAKPGGGITRNYLEIPDEVGLEWSVEPEKILSFKLDIKHLDNYRSMKFIVVNKEVSLCYIPLKAECVCVIGAKNACPMEGPFQGRVVSARDSSSLSPSSRQR